MSIQLPIKLNYEKVRAKALQAWNEGNLSIQKKGGEPMYLDLDGYVCAIGASLTPEQANYCDDQKFYAVGELIRNNVIEVSNGEKDSFEKLQYYHDRIFSRSLHWTYIVFALQDFMNFLSVKK